RRGLRTDVASSDAHAVGLGVSSSRIRASRLNRVPRARSQPTRCREVSLDDSFAEEHGYRLADCLRHAVIAARRSAVSASSTVLCTVTTTQYLGAAASAESKPSADIVTYPRRVAHERVAIAPSGRTNADKSLDGTDLRMRDFRRQHLDRPIAADEPQFQPVRN